MSNLTSFQPNWISQPGDTIANILEEKQISINTFAKQMNSSIDFINTLIKGQAIINEEMSAKLSNILGSTAQFWLRREKRYREELKRFRDLEEQIWLKQFPAGDMVKFGWILPENKANPSAFLDFFGVDGVQSFEKKYSVEMAMVSFRTSTTYSQQAGAVAAWLRIGELKANEIVCATWNSQKFRSALDEIKKLTRSKDPRDFIPILTALCAECGVALVIAPAPTGCRASGVTKFLNPKKAFLMLSFRYLSDDHFWFTFFHEAGHLLLHGNKAVFIEEVGKEKEISDEEKEANDFSAEILVPQTLRPQLLKVSASNKRAVISFATLAGVSPGIIIGQLQFMQKIDYGKFNSYKRRYSWEDIF